MAGSPSQIPLPLLATKELPLLSLWTVSCPMGKWKSLASPVRYMLAILEHELPWPPYPRGQVRVPLNDFGSGTAESRASLQSPSHLPPIFYLGSSQDMLSKIPSFVETYIWDFVSRKESPIAIQGFSLFGSALSRMMIRKSIGAGFLLSYLATIPTFPLGQRRALSCNIASSAVLQFLYFISGNWNLCNQKAPCFLFPFLTHSLAQYPFSTFPWPYMLLRERRGLVSCSTLTREGRNAIHQAVMRRIKIVAFLIHKRKRFLVLVLVLSCFFPTTPVTCSS